MGARLSEDEDAGSGGETRPLNYLSLPLLA